MEQAEKEQRTRDALACILGSVDAVSQELSAHDIGQLAEHGYDTERKLRSANADSLQEAGLNKATAMMLAKAAGTDTAAAITRSSTHDVAAKAAQFVGHISDGAAATVLDDETLVTFWHGIHQTLKVDDAMQVELHSGTVDCQVKSVHPRADIVILKASVKLAAPRHSSVSPGQEYIHIGFSNESTDDRRSVQHGIIVSKAADRSGFIRGSSSGNPGDSGGGCFAVAGGDLLAISVANERVPIHDSTTLYELGARHAARSILVPVDLMTFLASS